MINKRHHLEYDLTKPNVREKLIENNNNNDIELRIEWRFFTKYPSKIKQRITKGIITMTREKIDQVKNNPDKKRYLGLLKLS